MAKVKSPKGKKKQRDLAHGPYMGAKQATEKNGIITPALSKNKKK